MPNKIKWKNIYYMLTYAIDELSNMGIGDVEIEKCNSLDDLFATLMKKSIDLLYDNRYLNEYNKSIEITAKPHGKILINKSYNYGCYAKGKLCCEYSKLDMNNICNQIIKSAINILNTYGDNISKENIYYLNNVLDDLQIVDNIDIYDIDFSDIEYTELPDWYKPAIVTSRLIIEEMLCIDEDGDNRLFRLNSDKRLNRIFEKFVLNFYKLEYTNAKTDNPYYEIKGHGYNKLDILVEKSEKALIMDTKWYDSNISYSSRKANIREVLDYIVSYKENESSKHHDKRKETFGMLLYARTDENDELLNTMVVRSLGTDYGECLICEKTIDLNQDFDTIKSDLINLADEILK